MLMQFACIQDCSVCPLACYRGGQSGQIVQIVQSVQDASSLPVVPQTEQEPEETAKSEVLTDSESIITDDGYTDESNNAIQEGQNLPVLADVQYVDVTPKKGILSFLKKRG